MCRRTGSRSSLPLRSAPFVNSSTGSSVKRYGGIVVPVLSVTSDVDGDPLRIVADRARLYTVSIQMNGPDKYFLSLYGVTHSSLSGTPDQSGHGSSSGKSARDGASKAGGESGRQRSGSADAKAPGKLQDRSEIARAPKTVLPRIHFLRGIAGANPGRSGRDHRILDAYVKGDLRAREWLSTEANARSADPGNFAQNRNRFGGIHEIGAP